MEKRKRKKMSEEDITYDPSLKEKIRTMMHNMSEWWDKYSEDELLGFLGHLAELINEFRKTKGA